jgi:adhesin transport system outer membrane protein
VITADRIAALVLQTEAARKVIEAYSKEYDLGQRSLIDLLNAENTSFNAQVSLISARSVAIFADYQLLAAMGKLIEYIRAPHPVDAEPLVPPGNFGLIPVKLPPILINIPQPGPEPLNVAGPRTQPVISGYVPPTPDRPIPSPVPGTGAQANADDGAAAPKVGFSDRWLDPTATAFARPAPLHPLDGAVFSGAVTGIFTPNQLKQMPQWPIKDNRAEK